MVAAEMDAAFRSLHVMMIFGSAVRAPYGALRRRLQRHPRTRRTGCTATGKAAVVLPDERAGQRIASLVVVDCKLYGSALCDDGSVRSIPLVVRFQSDFEPFSTRFDVRRKGYGLGVAPR